MTKSQRAQVVELLRCAADGLTPTSDGAWTDALVGLDASLEVEMVATHWFVSVLRERSPRLPDDPEIGRFVYLEAALRVEEGWTP